MSPRIWLHRDIQKASGPMQNVYRAMEVENRENLRKAQRTLEELEREVITTSRFNVVGYVISEELGHVTASSTQTTGILVDVFSAIRGLFGGEDMMYSRVINRAHREARRQALEQAKKLGANAVVNFRYRQTVVTGRLFGGGIFATALVHGTAVSARKIRQNRPLLDLE